MVFHFFLSTSQEIGWEMRPRDDVFCVEWDVKHSPSQIKHSPNQSALYDREICQW